MEITRLFDYLTHLEQFVPEKQDMFARKTRQGWIKYSVTDYVNYSHAVARALLAMGYAPDTKVISVTPNRPEWNFIDMGVALAHMIHVPIYPTLSADEFSFIINHSDAQVIFVGTESLYNKIKPVADTIDREIKIILLDDSDTLFCFKEFLKLADGENREELEAVVTKNIAEIDPDTCVSIVYTSGTTGQMKGVMLSHRNLTFDAHGHVIRNVTTSDQKAISFLPLCHAYERTMSYHYQERGMSIYYAENIGSFASDLADCHGDMFCGVPRVLEVMYGKFEAAGKNLKGISRKIYSWAMDLASNYDNTKKNPFYRLKIKIADKLVYSKWRANLGGHNLTVVSGGSSIQEKIIRCFNAAKMDIYEGYGLTETSPVIAVNNPKEKRNVFGTVGEILDGTEIKFAEDGEILTKGPHVMLGYYKNPEQTAMVIDKDGFFHTGDIGYMKDGKYLKITDRKKEIFKLSNGKYIAPQAIETLLNQSYLFDNSFIMGENQKFASAIITVNKDNLKSLAEENKISYASPEELLDNPQIVSLLNKEVSTLTASLASYEQLKRYKFVLDEWTTANGLLSQTLKLKRAKLAEKYSPLITEIFS
ncbi:MAG: long-chain fatty acid--CoA ligase [Bacteroidales bacterium]|nr:long-chain fatty acid--CoA ligase [Bacteroidales bacterium]